jgi:hypothetical protein
MIESNYSRKIEFIFCIKMGNCRYMPLTLFCCRGVGCITCFPCAYANIYPSGRSRSCVSLCCVCVGRYDSDDQADSYVCCIPLCIYSSQYENADYECIVSPCGCMFGVPEDGQASRCQDALSGCCRITKHDYSCCGRIFPRSRYIEGYSNSEEIREYTLEHKLLHSAPKRISFGRRSAENMDDYAIKPDIIEKIVLSSVVEFKLREFSIKYNVGYEPKLVEEILRYL